MDDADGFLILLATRHDDFRRELAACVRGCEGGVLAVSPAPVLAPAPVVAVMPRRGADGGLGPATWLGPLHHPEDRRSVCQWLQRGGPLSDLLPEQLRRHVLTGQPQHTTS